MGELSRRQRLQVLEMATEIAAEAAGNTNIIWMIEFQEELIERLYHKMCDLLLEGKDDDEEEGDDDYSYRYDD